MSVDHIASLKFVRRNIYSLRLIFRTNGTLGRPHCSMRSVALIARAIIDLLGLPN